MKTAISALALVAMTGSMSAALSPPIVNPGAPGSPSRTITADESLELSQTRHTEADVQFMQHMIVHHNQAVQMGGLIEDRTDNRAVRLIGQRIALSQSSEMAMMTTWLELRGEDVSDEHLGHDMHAMHGDEADHSGHTGHEMHGDHDAHSDHAGHDMHGDHSGHEDHDMADMEEVDPREVPLMPGMLSEAQMERLEAAEGEEFDRLFLEGMIVHHQGAIDMVEGLMAQPGSGEDPQLSEFLSHVVADQSAEILRMRNLLSQMDEEPAHAGHH